MKIPKDKIMHFGVCFIAALVVSFGTWFVGYWGSIMSGGLFALGLGIGKEYGDSKAAGNRWERGDIVADCLGIGCALLVRLPFK